MENHSRLNAWAHAQSIFSLRRPSPLGDIQGKGVQQAFVAIELRTWIAP